MKVSDEPAARAGDVGTDAGLSKQKKLPLPLQPPEFSPPSLKTQLAGSIITADAKLAGGLNAIPSTPERPPSSSAAPLIPVISSVKRSVSGSAVVDSVNVYVMPLTIREACAPPAARHTPNAPRTTARRFQVAFIQKPPSGICSFAIF